MDWVLHMRDDSLCDHRPSLARSSDATLDRMSRMGERMTRTSWTGSGFPHEASPGGDTFTVPCSSTIGKDQEGWDHGDVRCATACPAPPTGIDESNE